MKLRIKSTRGAGEWQRLREELARYLGAFDTQLCGDDRCDIHFKSANPSEASKILRLAGDNRASAFADYIRELAGNEWMQECPAECTRRGDSPSAIEEAFSR
jgi:hypothetical protein